MNKYTVAVFVLLGGFSLFWEGYFFPRVKICLNPFFCIKFLFLIHVSVQDKKAGVFFPAVYILAWVLERSLRSGRGMTSIARKEKTRFTEVSKQSLGKPQCLFN